MHFTHTSMLLYLPFIFSAFPSTQGLNQNQTCANACTAAQACDHQCVPGTTYNPDTNTDIYIDCLCQSGCLCNAEICVQCCEAAGDNGADSDSCPLIELAAGNVLAYCSVEGTTPAKTTPAKACFVYGNGENGSPTSTYASASPFPSSVESFIAGLLPLTNITVAASSLVSGKAGATSSPSTTTELDGNTSILSQTAKVDTTTGNSGKAATTSTSLTVGKATTASTASPITSAPASTTGQPSASSQKSAAEGTWPMLKKGFIVLLALPLGLLLL